LSTEEAEVDLSIRSEVSHAKPTHVFMHSQKVAMARSVPSVLVPQYREEACRDGSTQEVSATREYSISSPAPTDCGMSLPIPGGMSRECLTQHHDMMSSRSGKTLPRPLLVQQSARRPSSNYVNRPLSTERNHSSFLPSTHTREGSRPPQLANPAGHQVARMPSGGVQSQIGACYPAIPPRTQTNSPSWV
jgi:hypothetical protein